MMAPRPRSTTSDLETKRAERKRDENFDRRCEGRRRSYAGLPSGHGLYSQAHRGISQYQVVAGVVACDPPIAELGDHVRRRSTRLLFLDEHGQLCAQYRPATVKVVGGLSYPTPGEQQLHHAPEILDLRLQPIRLERKGPGAIDMRQHGERSLGEQALGQSSGDGV